MKNIDDILFITQARSGSVRVVNKMLRPFGDSCLFEIALTKILASKIIPKENYYVSVRDQEFIDISDKHGVNKFIRSEASVQEPVTVQKVLEWHDKLDYKYWVKVNACNPLLTVETIDKFVEAFMNSDSRGMFGVFEKKTFLFDSEGRMLNKFHGEDKYLATLETKFVETCYEAAHSLYAGTCSDIADGIYTGTFKDKGNPEFFPMDVSECFDIDWPWQFELAEAIYKNRRAN